MDEGAGATVLRWADRRTEPWANGAGVTHPLAQGESWRVSIAEIVASAPFSLFAGIHRQFTCLGPEPVTLYVDGLRREVAVGASTSFAGESAVRCEVAGATLALNVMSRVGEAAPAVRPLDVDGATLTLDHARRWLIVVREGEVQVTTTTTAHTLTPYDAIDCLDTDVHLNGSGHVVAVQLSPALTTG